MTEEESDMLRGMASEIIIRLMNSGRYTALYLLLEHVKAAIDRFESEERGRKEIAS